MTKKKDEALEVVKNSSNVIEAIYTLGKWGEDTRRQITPLFFEDIRKYYPEIQELFFSRNSIRDYTINYTLITKGMEEGIFLSDLNADMVNNYVHEMMNIIHDDSLFPKNQYSEGEIFKNIIKPYFTGICTKKGQQLIAQYFDKKID
jgi:hypothetical protein